MQVSVESLEGLERKMTVQIPAERILTAVDSKLESVSKTVRVDGFRPGKVPLRVVRQMYGGAIRQEVLGDLIQETYQEALSQEKIRAAGKPKIDAEESPEKDGMAYSATFEVYPEIETIELESINIEKPSAEIVDADLDAMLHKLQEQKKTWETADKAADDGDQVTCDFVGKIDGEVFSGGSGKDMKIVLGEGKMLKDFEAGLSGMKAGDTNTVDVPFPEDYHGKDVAGKTAQFELTVTDVATAALPEIDEQFAKDFGVEDGNIETLKSDVKANMQKELGNKLKSDTKNAVMAGLIGKNEVLAPAALVADEITGLKRQAAQNMGQDPEKIDTANFPDELFKEEAERRVKLGVLVGEIIRQQNIELDQEKLDSTLLDIASSYDDPQQVMNYYNQNKQARGNLEGMVLEDQVVDFILSKAQVTDKVMSFDEIMNNR